MLVIDVNKSTEDFMEKLRGGGFTMPTVPNHGEKYIKEKAWKDIEVAKGFSNSDLARKFNEWCDEDEV